MSQCYEENDFQDKILLAWKIIFQEMKKDS